MSSTPYMPFFIEAYLSDTHHLTLEEQGAYTRLLFNMWLSGGSLVDNDVKIARLLGVHPNKWRKIKPNLVGYFHYTPPDTPHNTPPDTGVVSIPVTPGVFTQKRLLQEYQKVQGKRETNRQNVLQRWGSKPAENKGNDHTPVSAPPDTTVSPPPHTAVQDSYIRNDNKLKLYKDKNIKEASLAVGEAQTCGQLVNQMVRSLSSARDVELHIRGIFTKAGLAFPNDGRVIQEWLAGGAIPELHIFPVIGEIISRNFANGLAPPKTLTYFSSEIFKRLYGGGA